jgi:hypothetical protein
MATLTAIVETSREPKWLTNEMARSNRNREDRASKGDLNHPTQTQELQGMDPTMVDTQEHVTEQASSGLTKKDVVQYSITSLHGVDQSRDSCYRTSEEASC